MERCGVPSCHVQQSFLDEKEVTERVISVVKNFEKVREACVMIFACRVISGDWGLVLC